MRALTRIALAAATAGAAVAVAAAPASAAVAVPCKDLTIGSCYVHDPNGSYTCTIAYFEVGNTLQVCLLEWQP